MRRPSLEEVFSPRSVAVVGASPPGGSMGLSLLKEMGFPVIYPVNPKYTEVLGLPCYPSLMAIPGEVDYVMVNIPAERVLEVLDECAAKGVKVVRFFTAGFSESGVKERAELERKMLEKARAGGFRILGPNCQGLVIPKLRLHGTQGVSAEPGPIAFISQSGGHIVTLPLFGGLRGLRFSKVVSYGNALDVNESELLEYLAEDQETEMIAAYIEGVVDGRRFVRALKETTARKPVVIFKSGSTEAGKRACLGHTASLAGSVEVFEALCRQMNAIQVDDIDELEDVLVALRFAKPLPQGTGVAVIGQGGGPSVWAGEEMERAGLRVPPFSPEVQAELRQFIPLAGSIILNPVDSEVFLRSPEAIARTMRVVGKTADIDMFLYQQGFHGASRWGGSEQFSSPDFLQFLIDTFTRVQKTTGKPVLLALGPAADLSGMKERTTVQEAFVQAGFPVFHSFRRLARAMARVIAWSKRRS